MEISAVKAFETVAVTPSAGAASGFAEVLTSASGGPPGPEPPPGAPQAPGGEVAGNEQKALPQGLDSHLPDASGAFVAIASSDKVEAPAPPKPKGAVAPDFAIAAVANAVAVAAGGFIEQAAIATTAGSASPSNAVVDSTLVEPTACAIPAGQMQPIPGPTPPDEGSSKGGFEPNQSSGSKPSDRRPASTELGSPNSDKVPTQAAKAVNVADVDPSATLVGVAPVAAIPAASRAALRVDEAGTPQNPLAPKSDDAVRGDGVGKEQPTSIDPMRAIPDALRKGLGIACVSIHTEAEPAVSEPVPGPLSKPVPSLLPEAPGLKTAGGVSIRDAEAPQQIGAQRLPSESSQPAPKKSFMTVGPSSGAVPLRSPVATSTNPSDDGDKPTKGEGSDVAFPRLEAASTPAEHADPTGSHFRLPSIEASVPSEEAATAPAGPQASTEAASPLAGRPAAIAAVAGEQRNEAKIDDDDDSQPKIVVAKAPTSAKVEAASTPRQIATPGLAVSRETSMTAPSEAGRTALSPSSKAAISQIADRIELMAVGRSRSVVTVHMQPDDLGSVTLTVRSIGRSVEATVEATNAGVRSLLTEHRSELGHLLAQRGLQLDGIKVLSPSTTQGHTDWAGRPSGQPPQEQQARRHDPQPRPEAPVPQRLTHEERRQLIKGGMLDFWI